MIVLGVILLIVGFLVKIAIVWTRGIALLVGAAPASPAGAGSRRPTPLLVSGRPRRG